MGGVVDKYLELIDEFLEDEMTADTFQTKYFKLFKNETSEVGDSLFRILDWLFAEVDAYVPDPKLRGDVDDLDDEQLVDRVKQAKARLLALM